MPYANLPKSDWGKMDDCVTKVMATGKDKQAAIAICYTSISKQQGDDEMSRQDRAKAKKRRAAKQTAVITDLSELRQAFGWSENDVKASYPWDSCIADQMKKYGSRTRAEKICGAIRANAGKALSDERIATIISLSPVTAPNFRAAIAEKGITDAPNLRVEDAQCCGNCQYYKELASGDNGMGMMASEPPDDSGICTKYDFEADEDWVCDAWAAVAAPDVAGAIQDAAQAIADAADGMGAMGKGTKDKSQTNYSVILNGASISAATTKDHVAVADMPRDQQQAVFATLAESGAIASAHPIVQTAHRSPIADMGQLSHEQKNALESAVKKGLLKKGKGGGFPIAKTVYAHPSYDIAGEHQRQVSHLRAIAGLESLRLFGKEGHLITADELIARAETLEATTGKSAEQLLREAVAEQEAAFDKAARPLTLFKQADGRLRVVGWASNNRRDKDNPPEIITEAAHKEFMSYLDAHPEHAPEFWHWHTPGTKYAKADWWDYADGFTVYSGLVDAGKEAQAEKAAAEGIGMSHGFHVLGYDNANHHITQYRTFEVSDLPKSRAANPYTSFSTIRKEASMAFSEAKKAYLLERLPAETVAELERKTSDLKAAADAAGIEAKEVVETPAEVATGVAAPVDEKADSKPTDKPAEVAADGGNAKPKADTSNADMMQMMSDMIDKKLAAMGKEVNAAVLTVAEAVKGINERVATVEETAAKAEEVAKSAVVVNAKSLDEIVAEMISPAPLRKGYRASAAADTRVPAKKQDSDPVSPAVKTVEEPTLPGSPSDWWTKEVMKPAGLA